MRYYEVFVADGRYRGKDPLIYSSDQQLGPSSVVTVPLRNRYVSGFVLGEADKPDFGTKPIKALLSQRPLPSHYLELAQWLQAYYQCHLSEALRQFAPSSPATRRQTDSDLQLIERPARQLAFDSPLTLDQEKAVKAIRGSASTSLLLHGDTGTGKTRVYVELAKETLASGRSVMLLTPEIALTAQLAAVVEQTLHSPSFIFHSQLTPARRKQVWLAILEAREPIVVIGPRSALFTPIHQPGLIIIDEAHEPAYKQEQNPRYHTSRVASQMGLLTGAKVILGTATPTAADYYLAKQRGAVVRMKQPALGHQLTEVSTKLIDLRERSNFSRNPYLSNQLIDDISTTLSAKKQVMIYLNRRGSARLILCKSCSWQLVCPNCDIPLIYHADSHLTICHICNYSSSPPTSCPDCANTDIIYKSIGTKALAVAIAGLFPKHQVARFDSDNPAGQRINELYNQLHQGRIDILVGTQLLAKGLDLPKLGLVGIMAAETSLALPDYTAEERSFQLLYQIIGRVGRGHSRGQVVVQSYQPGNIVLQAAVNRDWPKFYKHTLGERQKFRFPPASYLLKLVCRRATSYGAQQAATKLGDKLSKLNLSVEILGPAPSFYARRGRYYYWQLVVKSKQRSHLIKLAEIVPANWQIDLDPIDLL